jgi:uncharacterized protein YjbJ (UPF0337 family)
MGDMKDAANKTRVEGAKNQAAGAIKEGVSKATGNKSGEAEGKTQKTIGKGQDKVGKAAGDAADTLRRRV